MSNGQPVYPAADLSEQISTAGMEASGTGNMKFAMNGVLTIGTMDGANVELRERVGADNFFLFGLDAAGVQARREHGDHPRDICRGDPELAEVLELLASGFFARGDRTLFEPLLTRDPYLVLADFRSYLECQQEVGAVYRDPERWTRMSVLNCARAGRFSCDRTSGEYCREIWRVEPVRVELLSPHDVGHRFVQEGPVVWPGPAG